MKGGENLTNTTSCSMEHNVATCNNGSKHTVKVYDTTPDRCIYPQGITNYTL